MTKGVFVTGTDTDIGKTIVTAALLNLLRTGGCDAVPMKPVQTGCPKRNGKLQDLDLATCRRLTGLPADHTGEHPAGVYRYLAPCSPHLAARGANVQIDTKPILETYSTLTKNHDCVLVEGAGGVLVPLNMETTMLNLMQQLALPVVVTAHPGLGTINHTLMTVDVLKRAGLTVCGIVFCETQPTVWGDIEQDNWKTIEHFGNVPVLGRVPFVSPLNDDSFGPQDFQMALQHKLKLPDCLQQLPDANIKE